MRIEILNKAGFIMAIYEEILRLREEGFSDYDIQRVIIPVGLPIGSVTPEEISISIIAQIIEQRRRNGSSDLGCSSRGGLI